MLEAAIIEHASPTLAGQKAGCLFNLPMAGDELEMEIARLNGIIGEKGCRVLVMRPGAERSLVYLYRARDLRAMLAQRVAIAAVVASGRDIIVLDEPTSGLDFRHICQVAAILAGLAAAGRTVLVITHDPEFILACSKHVFHMEAGRADALYPLDEAGVRRMLSFFLSFEDLEGERAV